MFRSLDRQQTPDSCFHEKSGVWNENQRQNCRNHAISQRGGRECLRSNSPPPLEIREFYTSGFAITKINRVKTFYMMEKELVGGFSIKQGHFKRNAFKVFVWILVIPGIEISKIGWKNSFLWIFTAQYDHIFCHSLALPFVSGSFPFLVP